MSSWHTRYTVNELIAELRDAAKPGCVDQRFRMRAAMLTAAECIEDLSAALDEANDRTDGIDVQAEWRDADEQHRYEDFVASRGSNDLLAPVRAILSSEDRWTKGLPPGVSAFDEHTNPSDSIGYSEEMTELLAELRDWLAQIDNGLYRDRELYTFKAWDTLREIVTQYERETL